MTYLTADLSDKETLYDPESLQYPEEAHNINNADNLSHSGTPDPHNDALLLSLNNKIKELQAAQAYQDRVLFRIHKGRAITYLLWLFLYMALFVLIGIVSPQLTYRETGEHAPKPWVCQKCELIAVADIARWVWTLGFVDFQSRVMACVFYLDFF